MDPNPKFDKYAKAKIEEPNLRLPKALLKFNTDQSSGELCYMKIFEDDTKKHKHLAEEIAAGAKLDRKVYRIRNMELFKAIGDNFEDMQQMHKVSKATIGLVVDSESDLHSHSFLDLMGTVEQVKMAEELILDKILKVNLHPFQVYYSFRIKKWTHTFQNCMQTYEGPVFPVILMPPTVYGHEIRLPVHKVARLLGKNVQNVLAIEVVSGAWIQVDDKPPPGGPKYERIVNIYGPKSHVFKAVSLIHSQVFEPGECVEMEEELDMLFKELSFDEMMEGMKSRNPQMADLMGAAFASGVDSGSASGSGSGSGQTEEQNEQQVEDKDESKGRKKRQHEEDVTEAVAGEPKGSIEELD
ncbi:hypothetical protein SSX86_005585 [Deinandra increscens subsp. villosa]|uniref:K Homology domain-containing protein n=1 Tax=Deinandra increscens subsp. villosa TaxID=3103831 RepID=A0AAP0H708_9ASTR